MKTEAKYRERIYRRPVFRRHLIEVLGDNLPPPNAFLFEGIVLTDKHKEEDSLVTITRTAVPYAGQDKIKTKR